jgi:bifunctional NMN adenylyltransferase/nudix hydrolase
MTQNKCDILVFIGRFQPFHIGHKAVLDAALEQAKDVIVLVGSANRSRSFRNPWTFEERKEMISKVYPNETKNTRQLKVLPLNDTLYNDDAWTSNVQRAVDEVINHQGLWGRSVGLIGHSKDKTSYYLKLFPQWKSVNVKHEVGIFNATDIRKSYFRGAPVIPHDIVPKAIGDYLKTFMMGDDFKFVCAEAQWMKEYKASWASAPFPPTFVTVDNVVVQSGHILLVRRGGHPGKGLLALPGGFVNHDETLIESAIRELREETKLADQHGPYPMGKLKGFMAKQDVFDDPKRSVRGYTLTHAFLFRLPPAKQLMKVIGSDDAVDADWYPIGSLDPTEVFEDHYFIINKMLDGVS